MYRLLMLLLLLEVMLVQQGCYRMNAEKTDGTMVAAAATPDNIIQPAFPAAGKGAGNRTLFFNEEFVEALYSHMDMENIDLVFQFVFEQLPAEVYVYPTENYYYFSFYANGRLYCGNIRLGADEIDRGVISFAYYNYIDDPKTPHDSRTWFKKYDSSSSVAVKKIAPLRYNITYQNKSTIFQLNRIEQVPPRLFKMDDDEIFLSRTFDESGFQFFLLFKRSFSHFMWILNEEDGIPGNLEQLTDELVIDRFSGFVFFIDDAHDNRKILIGVKAQNVRRNNYWDGPFDQLADNYIRPELAVYIQKAYPYTWRKINAFGMFTEGKGMRMAISCYHEYDSVQEMLDTVQDCKKQPADEFLPCVTYDYKTSF